jgi:hypothetical protein
MRALINSDDICFVSKSVSSIASITHPRALERHEGINGGALRESRTIDATDAIPEFYYFLQN